jgi:hypothetical protein
MSDEVIIPYDEYEQLLEDQLTLRALQEAGVDNWSGYDHAMDNLNKENQ